MHGDPDVLQLSPGSKILEDPDGCSGVILMAVVVWSYSMKLMAK